MPKLHEYRTIDMAEGQLTDTNAQVLYQTVLLNKTRRSCSIMLDPSSFLHFSDSLRPVMRGARAIRVRAGEQVDILAPDLLMQVASGV